MDDLDYRRLCIWIEQQHSEAVVALKRTYDEHRRAVDAMLEQHRSQGPSAPAAGFVQKRHGNLIEAVRRAAQRAGRPVTLQDVEDFLKLQEPLLMAQSSRKSISTALRRLYEARQLVLVEEGRGTKPARYATASYPLNSGKEIPMDHVSGMPA